MKSPASKRNPLQKKSKSEETTLPADHAKKKNTSLRLNRQTLKALKIRAIENDTSIQKLVESLIEDYLSSTAK